VLPRWHWPRPEWSARPRPRPHPPPRPDPPAPPRRTFYAFDINNGTTDPGFIPVPGTNPSVFAQGDELIVNDQLTTTHKVNGGYPVVGHDAGVCTLTRIPEPHVDQTLANCVATAVLPGGSLTIQGVLAFQAQQPQPAVLAVTGGTGSFAGATGTVAVTFTKNYKILTITLT
jgi:Dirigent-like protein